MSGNTNWSIIRWRENGYFNDPTHRYINLSWLEKNPSQYLDSPKWGWWFFWVFLIHITINCLREDCCHLFTSGKISYYVSPDFRPILEWRKNPLKHSHIIILCRCSRPFKQWYDMRQAVPIFLTIWNKQWMVLLHNLWEIASRMCKLQTCRARQLAMHLLISRENFFNSNNQIQDGN